jgi:inner membrane protein
MDSITQASLGAAVGEALLGRKIGNKAILWGAVAGTLPDLDVLAYPLMDQIDRLGWHRGPSHAFFYLTLAAPLLGCVLGRIHKRPADLKDWTLLVFLVFVTHVLLDAFNVYGTQLFRPFSRWPVAFDSISIIDLLYTLPLLIPVLISLFLDRASPVRRNLIFSGLVLSTLYLGLTVGIKINVSAVARGNFERQSISAKSYITTPTLFNCILWRITAESDNGFHVGYYSLLDPDDDIEFVFIPQDDSLLAPYSHTDAVDRLLWFSRGYYVVNDGEEGLRLADIRFGTIDVGQPDSHRFIFEWRIEHTPDSPGRGRISQIDFPNVDYGAALGDLWQRLKGVRWTD